MREAINLSADAILCLTEPGELFSSPDSIRAEYNELAKRWHPDRHGNSPESNRVMAHINALYERALAMIREGTWVNPGFLSLTGTDGRERRLRYRVRKDFELGTYYVADTVLLYLVAPDYRDLYDNARRVISSFRLR